MTDLAAQTETAGGDLQTLQQQVADLQTRRDELTAEVQNYQNQRDQLQPQVDELSRTITQRGEELTALEQRIAQAISAADTVGRYTVAGEGEAQGLTLSLDPAGKFTLIGRGNRSVTGDYVLTETELQLTNAQGAVGNAQFPMTCPIVNNDNGFTIGDAPGCALHKAEAKRTATSIDFGTPASSRGKSMCRYVVAYCPPDKMQSFVEPPIAHSS
jgi:cell division septum initiation protein DivIVA